MPTAPLYELRRSGETLCRSSISNLGYAPETLKDMERHGLKPKWWTVVRDLNHNLIVRNKLTGEFKYLEKQGCAPADPE